MTSRARLTCLVVAAVVLTGRAIGISMGQEKITYNRDVRPILSNNCFLCHGRDEKNRKAKLRLDLRESATKPRKDGSPAIVPGKPDDSALVRRIFAEDETEIMPPPQSHKKLSVKEKETLKRWMPKEPSTRIIGRISGRRAPICRASSDKTYCAIPSMPSSLPS